LSYQCSQFGLGFDVSNPDWASLRFEALARVRGTAITIVTRTPSGRDGYGNRSYSESKYITNGFVEIDAGQSIQQVGENQMENLLVFIPTSSVVEPEWDLQVGGKRYRITSFTRTKTFVKVKAERLKSP
jgi:hypothetical protein